MNIDAFIDTMQTFLNAFLDSSFFFVLKIFLGIYTIVLIIDIILLLSLRNLRADLLKNRFGTAQTVSASKSKIKKRWKAIQARMMTGQMSECKLALLEADALVDEVLKSVGYSGEHLAERLEGIPSQHMEDIDTLKEAHELRNRVVLDREAAVEREQIEQALRVYETVLKKMEAL